MSLVAAAVVPHTPLLIPSVAKQHAPLVAETVAELTNLGSEIYAAQPDAVIILSPHGESHPDSVVVHTAETFTGGFAAFGDITTVVTAPGALGLTHQLKTAAEQAHLPLLLRTFPELDYGVSVPLYYLQKTGSRAPIIPISLPHHQPELLVRVGALLQDFCLSHKRRLAIIASCDFSRRSNKTASHHRPTNEERQLSQAITSVDPTVAAALQPQESTCGYGPLLVLLAAIHGVFRSGQITSFAAPMGVGTITASFSTSS